MAELCRGQEAAYIPGEKHRVCHVVRVVVSLCSTPCASDHAQQLRSSAWPAFVCTACSAATIVQHPHEGTPQAAHARHFSGRPGWWKPLAGKGVPAFAAVLTLFFELAAMACLAIPREIDFCSRSSHCVLIYSDASFEKDRLRVGWVIFGSPPLVPHGGTCAVPSEVVHEWIPQRQQIFPGEAFCLILLPLLYPQIFQARDILWFIDSQAGLVISRRSPICHAYFERSCTVAVGSSGLTPIPTLPTVCPGTG